MSGQSIDIEGGDGRVRDVGVTISEARHGKLEWVGVKRRQGRPVVGLGAFSGSL